MATASNAEVSDLTARWVAGWALSRGMASESTAPGAWLVHVGSEVRTREYVLVRPDADEVGWGGRSARRGGTRGRG